MESPNHSSNTPPAPPAAHLSDPSQSHHRSHRRPGRHRAVLVRYDDDEYATIARAAARAGLTPTGFVASVALAVAQATGTVHPCAPADQPPTLRPLRRPRP